MPTFHKELVTVEAAFSFLELPMTVATAFIIQHVAC